MSRAVTLPIAALDDDAAPTLRVRGYWGSVGYRLRHDPVTLFFGAIVIFLVLLVAGLMAGSTLF